MVQLRKFKLLASAASKDGIVKLIGDYYGSPKTLELAADGSYHVIGANGPHDVCRVVVKGKRWRFKREF